MCVLCALDFVDNLKMDFCKIELWNEGEVISSPFLFSTVKEKNVKLGVLLISVDDAKFKMFYEQFLR